MIKNFFWNEAEHRLRMFWRLALYMLILGVFFLASNVLIGFGLILVAQARGLLVLDDPQQLSMVLTQLMVEDPLFQAATMAATLFSIFGATWLAGFLLDRRPLKDFGFHFNRRWWADLGFGMALGALLMVLIFATELALGWIRVTGTLSSPDGAAFWPSILQGLFGFICVAIYEELFSRGYLLRNLAEGLRLPAWGSRGALIVALLLSSSVFGALHLGNPNASLVSTVLLVAAGIFLALGYVLTGELGIAMGLHLTWNFFQGRVFGFPVSGTAPGASFIQIQQGGPDVLTGGAFGPEAGLIGLAAILLGCELILVWVRWQYGQAKLQDRLAEYQPPVKPVRVEVIEPGQG
ncbi:MAG: type II CAAX endopeptidase family protein [Anaerolineaceae bacterium]|nr:type II CAAX endopeptidase family protein [Anaerolineaceae bacterium]